MTRVLVTGAAGFIGYHLAERLLADGADVLGHDNLNPYYDPALKQARLDRLIRHDMFRFERGDLEDGDALTRLTCDFRPDIIVHLAAQAGVRYSLENPGAYVQSNVVGSFNVLQAALASGGVRHLLMASTSSVYGANTRMPYAETHKADHPMTIYAATKKAGEAMAHSWAHLHNLPITMFRFFTVYGPWGRPDMAYYKFTKAILEGTPIDIYNGGQMHRDFTCVDDLVAGIQGLMSVAPVRLDDPSAIAANDSLSPVAPFRIVNIGNAQKVRLMDFIKALEDALGQKAICNMLPMQKGDVPATWADVGLIGDLTGHAPVTDIDTGLARFVSWYREYHNM